jgi:hypothetical protein
VSVVRVRNVLVAMGHMLTERYEQGWHGADAALVMQRSQTRSTANDWTICSPSRAFAFALLCVELYREPVSPAAAVNHLNCLASLSRCVW